MILHGFPRTTMQAFKETSELFASGRTITNRELVALSFRTIHHETEIHNGGGIKITKESPTLWRVNHGVPNLVVWPDQFIDDYQKNNPTNNSCFDHCIPYLAVQNKMSHHYITDSDDYFMIEPTDRSFALCQEVTRPAGFHEMGKANIDFWLKYNLVWRSD